MRQHPTFMNKFFSFSSSRNGSFLRVFGAWFALNPWGNCFSPAVCLNTPMRVSRRDAPWGALDSHRQDCPPNGNAHLLARRFTV
jgi:hypothetical protein